MVFSGTDTLSGSEAESEAESDSGPLNPFHSRNYIVKESELDKLFIYAVPVDNP